MFFSKKQDILSSGFLKGMVELHSHILPAVDDGAGESDESLRMVEAYRELGIEKVFCTPHMKSALPANDIARLQEIFDSFKPLVRGIEMRLASEYMLDERFESIAAEGKFLSYDGEHILVESNRRMPVGDILNRLFPAEVKGFVPLLAHPERYQHLTIDELMDLKERGVFFQMNLPSLGGYYGENPRERASQLLKKGCYDYMGLDAHDEEHIKFCGTMILDRPQRTALERLIENNVSLWK